MNLRESSGAPLSHSCSPSGAGRDRKVRTNTLRFLWSTFLNPAKGPRGRGSAGVCRDF